MAKGKSQATPTNAFSQGLKAIVDSELAALREGDDSRLPDEDYAAYTTRRAQYQGSVALLTIAQDDRLDETRAAWVEMEQLYAAHIRGEVVDGREELVGMIEQREEEIERLSPNRETLRNFLTELASRTPNDEDMKRIDHLRGQVATLEGHEKDLEDERHSLERIEIITADIDALLGMGDAIVHYRLGPARDMLRDVGRGEYTGPTFEPFAADERLVSDVFSRDPDRLQVTDSDVSPLEVNVENLPEVLDRALKMRRYVGELDIGSTFGSQEVRDAAGYGSAKAASAAIARVAHALNVSSEKIGPKKIFTVGSGPAHSDSVFLGHAYDTLSQRERAEVNSHYAHQGVQALREAANTYDGFNLEEWVGAVNELGFPITRRSLSASVSTNGAGEYGLSLEGDLRNGTFQYLEVIPTDAQVAVVQSAVDGKGGESFDVNDIAALLADGQDPVHRRVVQTSLALHYQEWSYKKKGRSADNQAYERAARPRVADRAPSASADSARLA